MKVCRTCGERAAQPTSARCNRCIEVALRRKCPDCGEMMNRKSKRCKRCGQAGLLAPNWNGGRTTNGKGYVRIKVRTRNGTHPAHAHPRVDQKGYILEHIVVMEEKIGRMLRPGENVHHINGKRDDNRPENLELWVSKQPLGQRPADLVKWAHEVIALYGEGV